MSNNQSSKELMEGTSTFRQAIEESNNNDAGVSKQVSQEDDYNQDADVDFSDINIGGKHFLIKAPNKKTESGIILSDQQRKQVQDVADTPGFNEDICVVAASEKCELVEVGNIVLLSPHVQALEVDLVTENGDKVMYLIIHEDYVLLTK